MATFPPRCFTCGRVILWEPYEHLVYQEKIKKTDALDQLNHRRMCCRRMFLGHNPRIEDDKNLYSRVYDMDCHFNMGLSKK
jgi:DNA-directed RNA polymerase subunit N (RpoN/RPB10)